MNAWLTLWRCELISGKAKHFTILLLIAGVSALLTTAQALAGPDNPPAPGPGEYKSVILEKGTTISICDSNILNEEYRLYINDIEIDPYSGWSYTAEEENEEIRVSILVTPPVMIPAEEQDDPYYLCVRDPNNVVFWAEGPEPLSEGFMFPAEFYKKTNPGRTEAEVIFETINKYVEVHNDKKETVILQCSESNYPEVSFLTFVAIAYDGVVNGDTDSNGNPVKEKLYKGSPISITIEGPPDNTPLTDYNSYYLVNLTERGWAFGNLDGPDENDPNSVNIPPDSDPYYYAINWNGLYYAVDNRCFHDYMTLGGSGGWDDPYLFNPITIGVGGLDPWGELNNPVVVGVHSWTYEMSKSKWIFTSIPKDPDLKIAGTKKGNRIDVDVKIDNVDMVRENFEVSPGMMLYPCVNGQYDGDPGTFIVKGVGRIPIGRIVVEPYYRNIMAILVDAQQRGTDVESGGGLDWLEVAATDAYNSNTAVTKCVWEIEAKELQKGYYGEVWPSRAHIVYLNPYKHKMRFNLDVSFYNELYAYSRIRDGVIDHEALHSYQHLRGVGVNDADDDDLFVEEPLWPSPHLIYAWDNKVRGFYSISSGNNSTWERFINGLHGDTNYNSKTKAFFLVPLHEFVPRENLVNIFKGGDIKIPLPSPIPRDLPIWPRNSYSSDVYQGDVFICLYRYPSCYLARGENLFSDFVTHKNNEALVKIERSNGYFHVFDDYNITISPYKYGGEVDIIEKLLSINCDGTYSHGLYAIITFMYPIEPHEMDAHYYGISDGE